MARREREHDYEPGDIIRGNGAAYLVLAVLGAGGMGAVYLVQDNNIGRRFVLKVLHKRLARRTDIKNRFEAEARVLGRLMHPGIVEIFQLNRTTDAESVPYYLMEVLEGESLAESLARKKKLGQKLDLFSALGIATKLLYALDHAHERGVVHRDIKPDNIYLHHAASSDPVVKLLDFGILKLVAQEEDPGIFLGTPRWASPEQLRGEAAIGPKSDLYSVGLILFQMLTGHQAFEGYQGSLEEMVMTLKVVPPLITKHGKFPPALVSLVASALAKDPSARPADAFAFASALRTIRQEFAPDREDPHTQVTAEVLADARRGPRDPSQITSAHIAAPTAPDADMGLLMAALRVNDEAPNADAIEDPIVVARTPVVIRERTHEKASGAFARMPVVIRERTHEKAGDRIDTTEELALHHVKRDALTLQPPGASNEAGPGSVEYLTKERGRAASTSPHPRPVVVHSTVPMAGRPGRFAQPPGPDARTPEPLAIKNTPAPRRVAGAAARLAVPLKLLPVAVAVAAVVILAGLAAMRVRPQASVAAPRAANAPMPAPPPASEPREPVVVVAAAPVVTVTAAPPAVSMAEPTIAAPVVVATAVATTPDATASAARPRAAVTRSPATKPARPPAPTASVDDGRDLLYEPPARQQ